MMNKRYFFILVVLAMCWNIGNMYSQKTQESSTTRDILAKSQESESIGKLNEASLAQINQVNRKLKQVSSGKIAASKTKMAEWEAQVVELAKELWSLLDEAIVSAINRSDHLTVDELNREFETFLPTTEKVDKDHSSTRVELYSVGRPDLYLAIYSNMFLPATQVTTLRVLRKLGGHWQVVGRMEDTVFVKNLEPQHREELKRLVEAKEPLFEAPNLWVDRVIGISNKSIPMNAASISPHSIQLLSSGGIRFASIHTTLGVGNITVHTLIEWQWTPVRGLEAVAWVWGDEWTYDEKLKGSVAKWHSLDKNKDGKLVKLEDFLGR